MVIRFKMAADGSELNLVATQIVGWTSENDGSIVRDVTGTTYTVQESARKIRSQVTKALTFDDVTISGGDSVSGDEPVSSEA